MSVIPLLMKMLSAAGAMNWGLVIFFKIDLVAYVSKMIKAPHVDKLLYGLISLSGLYALLSLFAQ